MHIKTIIQTLAHIPIQTRPLNEHISANDLIVLCAIATYSEDAPTIAQKIKADTINFLRICRKLKNRGFIQATHIPTRPGHPAPTYALTPHGEKTCAKLLTPAIKTASASTSSTDH